MYKILYPKNETEKEKNIFVFIKTLFWRNI